MHQAKGDSRTKKNAMESTEKEHSGKKRLKQWLLSCRGKIQSKFQNKDQSVMSNDSEKAKMRTEKMFLGFESWENITKLGQSYGQTVKGSVA